MTNLSTRWTTRYTAILAVCLSTSAYAGVFGPSNFDECLLESMKGVTSDVAARAIFGACRRKFPAAASSQVEPQSTELPPWVIRKLTGTARMNSRIDYFEGNLYNGDSEWTITEVTILLRFSDGAPSVSDGQKYVLEKTIKPLTNEDFFVSVGRFGKKNPDWSIVSAKGYKSSK